MSKIIYACLRDPSNHAEIRTVLAAICDRLCPDDTAGVASYVGGSDGVVTAITNPSDLIRVRGHSVAAGHLVGHQDWERTGTNRPDGAYAIFRSDSSTVEVVSDTLASRTIWYAKTEAMFLASTSQRAIVMLLESFSLNPAAVSWMLATGTLGPGHSWDRRLRCVPGASRVMLDRASWTLSVHTEETRFEPRAASASDHERVIVEALRRSVEAIDIANPGLAITLSGGFDCRTILCMLPTTDGLRAVTWGLRASRLQPTNDAFIAEQVARHFRLRHEYFATDLTDESIDCSFDRFVRNGEGRIDHVSGYADGFALWAKLVRAGVRGIIRGDVAFGRKPVRSPSDVHRSAGMPLWSDLLDCPALESLGLPPQEIPAELQRRANESLETWRDRLQQQYRTPFVLGALTDLKSPYVEVVNPLLAGSVIELVRRLPDDLRTNKALLKRISSSLSPGIPFAEDVAIQPGDDVLNSPRVAQMLRDFVSRELPGSAVPSRFVAYVADGLVAANRPARSSIRRSLRKTVRKWLPLWARRLRGPSAQARAPNPNRLAFRAYLVTRMQRLLADDARELRSTGANDRSGAPPPV
jgi:asparagine synthetase B (glutamine-hydrolysing)